MQIFRSDRELSENQPQPGASDLEFKIATGIAGLAMAAGMFMVMNEKEMSHVENQPVPVSNIGQDR